MAMTPMIDNCVAAGLERAYNRMNPNQYVREIYQNSVEAGATDIRLSKDFKALNALDVDRGCMIDNGPGIPFDDILNKINRINSSSKETGGVHDNFGIGLKVSALIPNSYGLVILCRTKERPKGFMVWLHVDDRAAGARHLISEENELAYCDEDAALDYEDRVDFAQVQERGYGSYTVDGVDYMSWWKSNSKNETGTAIIFLGRSPIENTFDRLNNAGRLFLSSRYLTYKVSPFVFARESRIFQKRSTSNYIRLADPINALSGIYEELEVIIYKGWSVRTFLRRAGKSQNDSKFLKSPLSQAYFKEAIIYKNECYGHFADLKPPTIAKIRSQWGIWSNKVGSRVTLLVYPPEYNPNTGVGIFPDDSRTEVLWRDQGTVAPTSKLPLDELREQYQKNMPERVRDLLDEISLEELTTAKKSKAAAMIGQWTKVPRDNSRSSKGAGVLIFDPSGDLFGAHGAELMGFTNKDQDTRGVNLEDPIIKPQRKKKEKTQEELSRDAELKRAREQRKKAMNEPPEVIFVDQAHIESEDRFKITLETGEQSWEAAFYQPLVNGTQGNKLYINRDHPSFYSYQTMVMAEVKTKGTVISRGVAQRHFIEPYFEEFGGCSIQHIKGYAEPSMLASLLSPERLTQSLSGHHIHLKVNVTAGSLKLLKHFTRKSHLVG